MGVPVTVSGPGLSSIAESLKAMTATLGQIQTTLVAILSLMMAGGEPITPDEAAKLLQAITDVQAKLDKVQPT